MRKFGLVICLVVLLFGLFGCGGNRERIEVSKDDVKTITVIGNDLGDFIQDAKEQTNSKKVILEQEEEIEVVLKAIENSTFYSGPITSEGENLNLIITSKDDTSETIHLWLNPDKNSGRIQKENHEGPIQLLNQEDVQNIENLIKLTEAYLP